jgi:tetratricopeptide (TPR) repeat protein
LSAPRLTAMARPPDYEFDIKFFESVLRREPAYTDVIEILGGLYTKHGRIADGLRMDRKLVRLLPRNATAHYNLACSLALVKRKTDALRALRQAIELGYRDFDWMQQDPDLDVLKNHPEFLALLDQLKPQS